MGFWDELKQGAEVVGRGVAAYYTAGASEIQLKQQRDARRAKKMGMPMPPLGAVPGARRPPARPTTGPPLAMTIVVGSLGVVALMVVAKGIR